MRRAVPRSVIDERISEVDTGHRKRKRGGCDIKTLSYFSLALISPIITAPMKAPKDKVKKYDT